MYISKREEATCTRSCIILKELMFSIHTCFSDFSDSEILSDTNTVLLSEVKTVV